MVRLIKDKNCGLGLTITCGDTYDTVLHGAFVELITPAGPADRDGNLSPGDQILAVNGIDVQNDHFLDVADLLQQCNSPVELVIGKPCTKVNVVKPDIFDKIEDKLDEPPCVKVRTWLSNKSTEATTPPNPPVSHAVENSQKNPSPPIPKPRKKWSEKDSSVTSTKESSVTASSVLNTVPDITVETCSAHTGQKKNVEENLAEMNCSIISEHVFRGKGSIPDIIASQVKDVSASDPDSQPQSDSWDYLNEANEDSKVSEAPVSPNTSVQLSEECITSEKIVCLTAGDVYHIVLDKKGGSLGLNIFQGKDPSCPSQRNIYVHSLISGGAAEIDNRIKPGDKLLEVNGVLLEKLSYNDVVNTLRESAQVTHLVLERGIPAFPNTIDESSHDRHSSGLKTFQMKREAASESAINKKDNKINQNTSNKVGFVITSGESSLSANENSDCTAEKEASNFFMNDTVSQVKQEPKHNLHFPAFDKHVNNMETSSLPNVLAKNLRNSVSLNSLPSASKDILHMESGFSESITEYMKDISGSVPYLSKSSNDCYQSVSQFQNSVSQATHNSSLNYTCYADVSSRTGDAIDGCTSPNLTKDLPHNYNGHSASVESISKSVMYRSTPNLTENIHNEEDKNFYSHFHRNKSTDCLLATDGINEDLASELHQCYVMGTSGNDINQVPKAPLRKKKLKRLEDILNYSNSENTFSITIRKSSRGLGLSICGGRNAHNSDPMCQLISIRKLYPLQPALECGKLAIGDIILEVNGTNMIGLSNTEALEILRSASTTVTLKIFRPSKSLIFPLALQEGKWKFPGDSQSSSASSSLSRNETKFHDVSQEDNGEFEVVLIKREGSLGFTVSRKDSQDDIPFSGIYVKSLIKEPALSDGRIHPGDRIVQVNGTDISSMSHAEAITFLRNAPESVTLKLFRCDPPVSPFTDDYPISKPLRWEAVELLNDRVRHKDNETSAERKAKRKLRKCTNDNPSNSSSESESSSSSSSSGQEHIISSCSMDLQESEKLSDEGPGLQRNQRPKSLDVLNTSDRKQRLSDVTEDGNFHRQASVIENPANLKMSSSEDACDGTPTKKGGKALLKWRGSTLPSEDSIVSDTEIFSSSFSKSEDFNSLSDTLASTEQNTSDLVPESEISLKETETVVQPKEPWVRTFDVELDRKWYGRLGFSLCDFPPDDSSPRSLLPCASEVKAVHPGSLAAKDGRIAVGDRLVEVNSESVLGKSAAEVIDMMRRLTGLTKMVFCRLEGVS